jgi:hypothetical protein
LLSPTARSRLRNTLSTSSKSDEIIEHVLRLLTDHLF